MFKKIFGKKDTQPEEKTPSLSPAITQSIQSFLGPRGIPSMPKAAQKAFELSVNPDADVRDFVEVIQADEGLSARIIKVANSVYFDRGRKSETIEQSVFVIGLSELRNLLNATTLNDLFPIKHPIREQLWGNAIATAIAARIIAKRFLPEKAEAAFMGGMMHDIGKLALLQRATKDYEQIVQRVRESGRPFHEVEADVFIFNHCEIGQLLGRQWNFSDDLLAVIRCHHDTWSQVELLGKEPVTMVRIVQTADLITHTLKLGHAGAFTDFSDHCRDELKKAWKALRVSDVERQELMDNIQKTYEYEIDMYR